MNYLIIMREVSGQAAILPQPSKAKEVMVMSSCNHCIAFHFFSKLTLKLKRLFELTMVFKPQGVLIWYDVGCLAVGLEFSSLTSWLSFHLVAAVDLWPFDLVAVGLLVVD